jgi:hypothetical protein
VTARLQSTPVCYRNDQTKSVALSSAVNRAFRQTPHRVLQLRECLVSLLRWLSSAAKDDPGHRISSLSLFTTGAKYTAGLHLNTFLARSKTRYSLSSSFCAMFRVRTPCFPCAREKPKPFAKLHRMRFAASWVHSSTSFKVRKHDLLNKSCLFQDSVCRSS